MKISFFGAAQTVTGSKHLVELENGERLLLDCGMFQGMGKDTFGLNSDFGFDPSSIDYLLLTHAHVDHSGLIPKLVKDGFKGKIFCTSATYDLCKIMLADSAFIQEADVRFVNKRKVAQGKEKIEPLYNKKDVEDCLRFFHPVQYDQEIKLSEFLKVTFTNNGHILGSGAVNLKILEGSKWRRVFYSGDIGRYNTTLLQDPKPFPQADIIITESTYGDRLHSNIDDAEGKLLEVVLKTCVEKRGKIIIPSFSLGRTQEMIYSLNKLNAKGLLPNINIYVDSPLAINATKITQDHRDCLNDRVKAFAHDENDPFGFDKLIYVTDRNESKKLNAQNDPCIIISAAGMAEAGRVKHHIFNSIEDAKNTILIVGYAEPQSLGGKLRRKEKDVKIFGEYRKVMADVEVLDAFSAHADYEEIIKYLSCQNPEEVEKVFIVHGEHESQQVFKTRLKKAGFNNIYIPRRGDEHYV